MGNIHSDAEAQCRSQKDDAIQIPNKYSVKCPSNADYCGPNSGPVPKNRRVSLRRSIFRKMGLTPLPSRPIIERFRQPPSLPADSHCQANDHGVAYTM